MIIWIVYLFIGFITGCSFVELSLLFEKGELEGSAFDSISDEEGQAFRLIASNRRYQIATVVLLIFVWPWITFTIGPKMQLLLCWSFICDCVKGHF